MQLLERIEEQISTTRLPLVAITVAAVPYANTPVVLTLHWHGLAPTRLADVPGANAIRYRCVPSSALQINERWNDLRCLDMTAMEAAWELGAWDMARLERASCLRPGADVSESIDCLRAFGNYPYQVDGELPFLAETPDADELVDVATRSGYLTWIFRPVSGGLWQTVADDQTLEADGRRKPPCPYLSEPPRVGRHRKTVYRFGRAGSIQL
ncbi:MAG: diguanylate cyclase [Burkholderiales bacterium]|nr:diguanylate cyclase [Burkholderiales bacterium]